MTPPGPVRVGLLGNIYLFLGFNLCIHFLRYFALVIRVTEDFYYFRKVVAGWIVEIIMNKIWQKVTQNWNWL